jgi:amino acid adenylation domain-containing protein
MAGPSPLTLPAASFMEHKQMTSPDPHVNSAGNQAHAKLLAKLQALGSAEPDATAVCGDMGQLSFGELGAQVGALAAHLRSVTPAGAVIALLMGRCPQLLVAQLACLCAARPFLLPPALPAHELAPLLAESQVALALGVAAAPASGVAVLDLATQALRPAPITVDAALPLAPAYVIYTSGSTGRPKAIAVTRAGLANYLQWAAAYYCVSDTRGALAQLSPSFDASITQLLLPLLEQRAVLLVAPGRELVGLSEHARALSGRWLLKLTPAQLPALEIECSQPFDQLEGELVVGGEALLGSHVECARRLFPRLRLHNEYGPSETVVGCTIHTVGTEPVATAVPIGRPIAATTVLVADDDGRPCAGGAVGELCIGGPGVALGYIERPGQTAQAFVPAAAGHGERLYRTGDFVREDEDGVLHYVGRRDSQVKVRGVRIELGEVQARLEGLPGVAQAAADLHAPAGQEAVLVAYVRLAPHADLALARTQAAERLPAAMVPSRWVQLERFPLTGNGKASLDALRALLQTAAAPPEPARDEGPAAGLRAVWRELLNHDEFGDDDAFFAVGGHSILAVRLRAAIRKRYGVEFALAELNGLATLGAQVAALAARLGHAGSAADAADAPVEPVAASYPLSCFQEPLWLAVGQAQRGGHGTGYVVQSAVRIAGSLDAGRLHDAFLEVARRHGSFHTAFAADGVPRQVVGEQPRCSWQQVQCEPGTADAALRAASAEGLDLAAGPLLRVRLWQSAAAEHLLLWQVHHMVIDEWSMQLLIDQVLHVYQGHTIEAPPLHAYGQFSQRQQEQLSAGRFEPELAYWRRRFADVAPGAVLPRLPGARPGGAAGRRRVPLAPHAAKALLARAAGLGITVNAAAMGIVGLALAACTGLPEVRLAAPVAVRDDAGLDKVLGYFLNTLVFRIEAKPALSLQTALREAAAYLQEDLAHKALPYEAVRQAVPLLQAPGGVHARFAFVSGPAAVARLPGCEITTLELPAPSFNKFELLISAVHAGEQIEFCLDYDSAVHAGADIEQWARAIILLAERFGTDTDFTLAACQAELVRPDTQVLAALASRLPRPGMRSIPASEAAVHSSAPDWLRGAQLIEQRGTPMALADWLSRNRAELETRLHAHGAILLRGFSVADPAAFEAVVGACGNGAPADYENRSTPRTRVHNNIFTSTEYPASESIELHNENAYHAQWPARLLFWCRHAAAEGGETPIADSRRVLSSLSPRTRALFEARGVRYVRNYGRLGLSWQETFQTTDPGQVERYCRAHGIEWQWQSGGGLRTWQSLPAIRRHPVTGEAVWFNQAHLFHVSSLGAERAEQLLQAYGEHDLPRHALFGDGQAIDSAYLDEVRAAYAEHAVPLPWRDGDVAILDNMLYAHGRLPFKGERRVLVGMVNLDAQQSAA